MIGENYAFGYRPYGTTVDELTPGTVTRTFYDRMPARDTLGVELYPPSAIVPAPTYTLGRVAAVVSDVRAVLDANGSAVQASDGSDSVIRVSTANSYDKYGRVLSSYAFDPTVPAGADSLRMLWSDTKYDLGGKVVSTTRNSYGLSFAGIVFRSVTERYTYDRLGRVDNIYSSQGYGNAPLAHYEYYPTGSVKSVNLGNSLTLAYTYHISGAVKTATVTSIGGDQLYSETLNYEDCGNGECTPQYNGNISRMAHQLAHGNTAYSENRNVTYYYDQLNRLASAEDIVENAFDEMFEYDAQGRIVSQRRAGNTSNTSGGEYAYESGSNRLKSVAAGMGGTAGSRDMSDADNFVYDQDGNLVEDKSKNMKITYDWRGMPVEFLRQTGCYDYHGLALCDSTKLVIAYDGSGRRISKTRMKESQNGTWWTELVTHYTGIGTEIRENPGNNEAKVVMNMPNGLGRYEPEDAAVLPSSSTSRTFEWYLKNHLGSTMLVYASGYGTPGVVRAAYDYRAFGEQVSLTESADKVTENFTGKEKDDETELNYFGARYLDPMLGMWTSVDPARQFASPYLYAGNGVNPVNGVDGDGNYYEDEYGRTNQDYDYVIQDFQGMVTAAEMDAIIDAHNDLQSNFGLLDELLPRYAFQSYWNDEEIAFDLKTATKFTVGEQRKVLTVGPGFEKNVFHLHTFRYNGSKEGFSPNDNGVCNLYERTDYMMEITSGNVYFQNVKVNNIHYPGVKGNYIDASAPFLLLNIPLTSPSLNYTPNR